MILNSPYISGSLTVTGNIISSGSITISGSIASASYAANATSASYAASASNALAAATASYVLNAVSASYAASASNALSASNAVIAQTASYANALTVAGTLTAQTLVVQTITSSVDYVTGSTRFGSLSGNTHTFTGSILTSGSVGINSTSSVVPFALTVYANGTDMISWRSPTYEAGRLGLDTNNAHGAIFLYSSGSQNIQITSKPGAYTYFNAGNVGIGTATPNNNLHIYGNNAGLNFSGGNNRIYFGSARAIEGDGTQMQIGEGHVRTYLQTSTGGTVMAITGSNVGIGTTSLGSWAKLQVAGNIATTGTGYYWSSDLVGGSTPAYLEYNYGSSQLTIGSYGATANGYIIFTAGGSSERMRITSAGNVGIGTSSPTSKLQIEGGQYNTQLKLLTSGTNGAGINLSDTDTGGHSWYIISTGTGNGGGAGNLGFYDDTNGNYLMYIKGSNGYVGLGTTAPSTFLHILANASSPTATIRLSGNGGAATDSWDANAGTDARYYVKNVSTANGAYLVYNSSGGWTSVSDARWKTDWTDLGPSLSLINQLKIGRYKMLDANKQPIENARWDYGVKAQELLKVIPDAVDVPDNPEDKHGVINNIVFYHAIKAIQELKAEVDELKNK